MTPHDNGLFGDWGFIEWAVSAAWAAGMTVVGFLWRLQTRVAMLEHNDRSSERRHQENLQALQHLEDKIERLTGRIDTIVDRARGA